MISAAIIFTRTDAGGFIYLIWLTVVVGIVLVGPWPRPVTRFRRSVSAAVVALLLSGCFVSSAKHSALVDNPCEMWGDGWWKSLCEWMP